MTRARDVANVLSTSTALATDVETAAAISSHNSATTSVHGITNTATLATQTYADSAVSTHAAAADPHTVYLKESEFNAGGKNAIINGGFDIWQRGISFTGLIGNAYGADRWMFNNTTGRTYSRQLSGLDGIQYCVRVARDSGQTNTNSPVVICSMESAQSIPFAGKTATLSYYARAGANFSSSGNVLRVIFDSGTGTDQNVYTVGYTGASNLVNASSVLTTSWQRFTHTFSVPSTCTEIGGTIFYSPTGTAGANDWFEITGFQLEVGSTATPFSRAGGNIQGELAACQRYYWRQVSGTTYGVVCTSGIMESTTTGSFVIQLPVPMRVAPTSIDTSNLRITDLHTTNSPASSFTLSDRNELFVVVRANASGLTANRPAWLTAYNSGASYLGLSAEL